MAGVFVSMRGVCVATAGLVLCAKVPERETGEMGLLLLLTEEEVGGMVDMGAGEASVIVALALLACLLVRGVCGREGGVFGWVD